MPSKRQTQPVAVHSDYDTETTPAAAFTLPQHTWTRDSLNEAVVKRHQPDLVYIEKIAPFSVIYTFSPDSQQWEKSGCEGTMFLCELTGGRYSVVVLNRKSLDNFIVEIKSLDDVEITNEYIILQTVNVSGTPQVYGLWIYSAEGENPSMKDLMGAAILNAATLVDLWRQGEAETKAIEEEGEEMIEDEEESEDENLHAEQSVDLLALLSKPQVQRETHVNTVDGVTGVGKQQMDLLKLFGKSGGQSDAHNQRNIATLFPG